MLYWKNYWVSYVFSMFPGFTSFYQTYVNVNYFIHNIEARSQMGQILQFFQQYVLYKNLNWHQYIITNEDLF